MAKTYKVLLVADQHGGNEMGLLHPEMPGFGFMNKWQEYAWKCWEHMLLKLPRKLDVVVSMDEAMDGPADSNKKYRTQIAKPSLQRQNAQMLLGPLQERAEKFFMIAGSNWHVDKLGESTRALAEIMGADRWPDEEPIGYNLFLQFGNVILDLAHSQSVVMVNRGMPPEREMRYRLVDDPFRGEQRQIKKKSMARSVHDMGWVLLHVTPGGEWPVIPYPCLYDQPQKETVKIP
jgi:hypothetical protein